MICVWYDCGLCSVRRYERCDYNFVTERECTDANFVEEGPAAVAMIEEASDMARESRKKV